MLIIINNEINYCLFQTIVYCLFTPFCMFDKKYSLGEYPLFSLYLRSLSLISLPSPSLHLHLLFLAHNLHIPYILFPKFARCMLEILLSINPGFCWVVFMFMYSRVLFSWDFPSIRSLQFIRKRFNRRS